MTLNVQGQMHGTIRRPSKGRHAHSTQAGGSQQEYCCPGRQNLPQQQMTPTILTYEKTPGTSLGFVPATSCSRATRHCGVESGTRRTGEVLATTMAGWRPTSWRTPAACTASPTTSSSRLAPAAGGTTCRRQKLFLGRRTSRSTLSVWRRRSGCPGGCRGNLPAATFARTRSLPRC